jgi:7,8-dihydro-6-hydroxymethylpterin-pyrophosphokinase
MSKRKVHLFRELSSISGLKVACGRSGPPAPYTWYKTYINATTSVEDVTCLDCLQKEIKRIAAEFERVLRARQRVWESAAAEKKGS